ncbi:MAG: hypothetical protein HY231_24535 [Acidobacteria bacterium]|nr:hypothetical protein [Acidobacteriota bacterium]
MRNFLNNQVQTFNLKGLSSISRSLSHRIMFLAILAFTLATTAQASPLSFSFSDPVADNTGRIDVRNMLLNFDNATGAYTIVLTATRSNPFMGQFRVNINLLNPDTATSASFFQHNLRDFNLATATTSLTMTGTNSMLLSWNAGNRVATNNLPFGNPSGTGITAFRSAVVDIPFLPCAFCQEDTIAFGAQGFTTIALTGSAQNLPVLPTLTQPRRFIFQNIRSGWIDPPAAFGFKYSMTSASLFTAILDFPTGFNNLFTVSVGGIIIGTFGPGQSVVFPGAGVSEFTITGINPLADTDDPTAFPLNLAFNTPTASLTMDALVFDICLQDDSNGAMLQFSSTTGEYLFTNCAGLTLGGTGSLVIRGSIISLQQNGTDRRVIARMDKSMNKGTASIQLLSQGRTLTIIDRNTADNTCTCP